MKELLKSYTNVPVEVAAKLLNVSKPFIYVGLQKGTLPIGTAVQITNEKYTYHISPGLLLDYIEGTSDKYEELKRMLEKLLERGDSNEKTMG